MSTASVETAEQFNRDFAHLRDIEGEAKKIVEDAKRKGDAIVSEAKEEYNRIQLRGEQEAEDESHEYENLVDDEITKARIRYDDKYEAFADEIKKAIEARRVEAVKKVVEEVLRR